MNKLAFRRFQQAAANYYNAPVDAVQRGEYFSLNIPAAALLGKNIQQRSDFLQKINWVQVSHVKGDKLWGATSKGITGRHPGKRHLTDLEQKQTGYELAVTDSGVIIPWQTFDNFAVFGDKLAALYAEYVQNQIALDQLQIGFNGKTVAADTKKDDLSDVNKGWLQLLAEQRSGNVLKGKNNRITLFGSDAEYASLDDLANELKQGLAARHQNRTDLIFMVGQELVNVEARYLSKAAKLTPTERSALNSHALTTSFAGMVSVTPPNFPARGACVTTYNNLSIYTEGASVRRRLRDDDDRMGIIDSYYRMEGYVVEDVDLMTAVTAENVVIGKPGAAMAEAGE